jgi:pyridoxal phosphate enzyme (YggS family)
MVNTEFYKELIAKLNNKNITLVAVSKTKSVEEILKLYTLGQRDFGENYVQELVEKQAQLPKDIHWHFIGHLQTNKVKLIAPFIYLIHSVDTLKLLKQVDKEAKKNNRVIDCLLQAYIASEETKFGLEEKELKSILQMYQSKELLLDHVCIKGLMGMASFTNDMSIVKKEFRALRSMFDQFETLSSDCPFATLSMGMSADYEIAIEEGSNMVRIGSLLFGKRVYVDHS